MLEPVTLDKVAHALNLAVKLWEAEEGMQTHKAQIDAFMQEDAQLSDEAQAAFDTWAVTRQNINRVFRHIGIKTHESWCARDYIRESSNRLKGLTP